MQASIEAAEDLAEKAINLNGRLLAERNAAQASEASLRKRWADLGTLYEKERARRQEAEQELARLRRGDNRSDAVGSEAFNPIRDEPTICMVRDCGKVAPDNGGWPSLCLEHREPTKGGPTDG